MKIPQIPFFLFGMGNRRKLLYKSGSLYEPLTGEILRSWSAIQERILPSEYTVEWKTRDGKLYSIQEDETGVCLKVEGTQTYLTADPLSLPNPSGKHAKILKILLHEVLVNIVDGRPLTHFLAQSVPTYRDAAIISECLRRTGNLGLVRDWILGLKEPFDYGRDGEREPDNLGQVLFLLSLVTDKSHPLVGRILESVASFRKTGFMDGLGEAFEHPVYQTKWLKFGLKSIGLEDPYKIPSAFDPYSPVFWMDYKDTPTFGPPFPEKTKQACPHLAWAEAHFHGWDPPMEVDDAQYPQSWEIREEGDEPHGMGIISREFLDRRMVAPQARHAAEMFLYFLDQMAAERQSGSPDERLQHAH